MTGPYNPLRSPRHPRTSFQSAAEQLPHQTEMPLVMMLSGTRVEGGQEGRGEVVSPHPVEEVQMQVHYKQQTIKLNSNIV